MAIEVVIVIFLIVIGIALLLAEIFLLPGISIAGFAGGICLIGGIIYAFVYIDNTAGFITMGASVVAGAGAFIYLIKSNAMDRIALETDIDSTVDQSLLKQLKAGDNGKTISRLNPIGKAEFGEVVVEAKSVTGEFIDEGKDVEIIKIDTMSVLVQELN